MCQVCWVVLHLVAPLVLLLTEHEFALLARVHYSVALQASAAAVGVAAPLVVWPAADVHEH